jgi:hypothetical protein
VHISSTGCFFLRAEGFYCSLYIFDGGIKIINAIFVFKKGFCYSRKIVNFLIKTMDPDPQWPKMLDPDQHRKQSVPTTMETLKNPHS